MNASRRKQIEELTGSIERIKDAIEQLRDEEQEAYDNLPEPLQDTERGDRMKETIDSLDWAADEIQDCLDHLCEAME